MGKQYLPLFIGLLILGVVLLLQVGFKLLLLFNVILLIPYVSIAMPIVTYGMRTKNSGDYPAYGCLIGSIVGFFTFVIIINFIMNLLDPNAKEYSIRIDLFLGGLLGSSILSTLGIIMGDRISSHNQREK